MILDELIVELKVLKSKRGGKIEVLLADVENSQYEKLATLREPDSYFSFPKDVRPDKSLVLGWC